MTEDIERSRLPASTLLPAAPDEVLDRIASLTRTVLGVPTALVTLVEQSGQVFPGAVGLPEPWQSRRDSPLTLSFCRHVVAEARPLTVADARKDPAHADNRGIDALGVVAYAGVPLTNRAGQVVGSLCAIDQHPRVWTTSQLALLSNLATLANAELQLREAAIAAADASDRAEQLIATMPVGYLAYDAEWRVTAANAEAARIVDTTVDALVGNVLWELFPATVGSEFDTIYRRVRATGTTEVFEYFYPDPLNKWYEIRVQSEPPGLCVFFVDITARHASEDRNRRILATMPVGFIMMDEAWTMTAVNAVAAELTGFGVADLIGRNHWDVFPIWRAQSSNVRTGGSATRGSPRSSRCSTRSPSTPGSTSESPATTGSLSLLHRRVGPAQDAGTHRAAGRARPVDRHGPARGAPDRSPFGAGVGDRLPLPHCHQGAAGRRRLVRRGHPAGRFADGVDR